MEVEMQSVRRVYLYAMSAATLAVVAGGIYLLTRLGAHAIGLGRPLEASEARTELSLALAALAVGIPVWAVHWRTVRRSLRGEEGGESGERSSVVRAAYATVVLAASLFLAVVSWIEVLRWAGFAVFGPTGVPEWYADVADSFAMALTATGIWVAHVRLILRDRGAVRIEGAAAWLPRVYLYGAILAGLAGVAGSVAALLRIAVGAVVPPPYGAEIPIEGLIATGAELVVWSLVWLLHWAWSSAAWAPDGSAERDARMRLAFYGATIGIAAAVSIVSFGDALQPVVARAFGVDFPYPTFAPVPSAEWTGLTALAMTLPWAVGWLLHARWLRREANERGDGSRARAERLLHHVVAAVALAFGAIGSGWVVGLAIDLTLSGLRTSAGSAWRWELTTWLPYVVVGLGLWAWTWRALLRQHAADPAAGASSTIRRSFLLLTVAVGTLAALGAATLIVYRLLGIVLGATFTDDLVSAISTPVGALVVGTAVAVYHFVLVRGDDAYRATRSVIAGIAGAASRRTLVLTGVEGEDLEPVVAALRSALPSGHTLEPR
jgi:hypothetical protein